MGGAATILTLTRGFTTSTTRGFTTSTSRLHTPMIQFRAGKQRDTGGQAAAVDGSHGAVTPEAASGPLEWWQLPHRFRRSPIWEGECEAITSGGADTVWS